MAGKASKTNTKTRARTVKTTKGASVPLFMQDQVSEYLPREIKLGEKLEIFCDYLYVRKTGSGILVNEFQNKIIENG